MFPPPWTTRHEVGGGSNDILALARKFQDLEKQQSSPGPRLSARSVVTSRTRLLTQHSHRCCRRKRIGRVPDEYHFNITTRDREHEASPPHTELEQSVVDTGPLGGVSSQACTTTTPLECSALGAPPTPSLYLDQTARDSRLSHPKRIPKCGVSANGARRLFGQTALVPLHSRARARARAEATLSAMPGVQRTESYGRRGKRSPNDDSRSRLSGLRRTASDGVADVRRTAWDDQQESGSILEYARNALNARRGRSDPSQPSTPQSRSDEGSSRGRTLSEDSISTQALVYGHKWRGQPPAGASSGLPSEGRNEAPSGYEEARKAFFDKFREVANKKQSDPDENVSSIEEESVRAMAWRPILDGDAEADPPTDPVEEATSKFLRQLNDHGRAPWPALLKLSKETRALEVGGMGLGDDLMAALAMVMPILRSVERLVAFDNRMTDFSLFRVVLAVQGMPSLTHLDLSENKIGALAAHALREYMRSNRCKLRSLAIRKADIDDDECREFMAALEVNVSLLQVDLTGNLIGMAETIKATGADSIAAMLSANCTLTSLNLGWNSIRMASAVTVAESLRDNHTLRSLGLAYNSFSDFASQTLAVALAQNDTLTSLDLSYNSVSPAAAIVLAFALKANTTLKFVELEGNRIGRNGGEALVMAMRTSTRRDGNLIVSVKNCDTSYNDETLLNVANATGEYILDLQTPYQKVVAAELLILANRKPTAHFLSLKHVTGKKVTNIKLRREKNAVETRDPGAAATRRINKWLASGGRIEMDHFTEFARAVELKPEPAVASKLMQIWNEVLAAKAMEAASNGDAYGGDLVARSFFESIFLFADKDNKGELVVNDLKILFQTLNLPYGNARIRHVMSKYDTDHSGSVDLEEFTHYMTATHVTQRHVEHGVLCTDDKKEWRVPDSGILRVHFVEEPNADRTLGEMSTDCGVEGLITNIRQSPSDDSRKRLFELATSNSRTYFTASQAQGLLEAISSNYHLVDAVAILMPQLASTQECTAFIDSNLDHKAKLNLRFKVGGAWGAMMGMPSAHYALDMQSSRDRLTASKMAAVANHERQHNQFSARVDTSQHGNWHNFRNAEYNREPVVLTSGWFVDLPKYGVLRFDYVSTSRPDHHQMPLPERRFQRMLARLGLSTPITATTPIDEKIITTDALFEACTSHWRKMASSSSLFKLEMRDYFRSGSALDDVSLASWWSVVDVKSVDLERRNSFAHLVPSDTYVKAWYKLKELEVALCSACLTTDQLARILESFPREGQIRAEVVVTFYHKVTDIDQMCLLVDALRPDESREVFARRGFLNVTNPIFADRYYRLDLSVCDDREMAKILIRLAMMEPGENWIDETYERKIELGPLPGWELPLDWTTPDITSDKKEGGPRRFGILTLWYASTPRLGCMPNLGVRQDLARRTLCSRVDMDFSSSGDEGATFDIVAHTFRQQQRFRSMLDKARQGMILLADEIAIGFTKDVEGVDGIGTTGPDTARTYCPTATSSLTEVGEEGELAHAWEFSADGQSFE